MRVPFTNIQISTGPKPLKADGTAFDKRTQLATIALSAPHLKAAAKLAAPAIPPITNNKADTSLVEILPPFSTNPPKGPIVPVSGGLDARFTHDDPRSLWYLALPSKLTPNQVLQILRSALGGDLWQQWQLMSLMLDTWPMLRKCAHELSEEVSYTGFKVKPFVENEGEAPDEDAKDRGDLVTRAMKGFNPNPFTDEKEFSGFVYNLCDAVLNGMSLSEIMWEKRKYKGNQWEWMPRAAAWVHPRSYTFTNDGVVALFDNSYHRMYNLMADNQGMMSPDPRKFMCAQFMSRSGSSLGAGLIRPLAWYWSAAIFCKEWMLSAAQKYGNPFLDMTYAKGTTTEEMAKLEAFMAQAGALGWVRHVEGTTLEVHPATATTGNDNSQRHLMEIADQAAMFLLLGQEGTTKSTPGKLGNEGTKDKVKRQRVEGIAKWVGNGSLKQFARAVLLANYGNSDKCPDIEPDFTESPDPLAQAQTDAVFIENKIPVLADEFYRRNGMQMPEAGDRVLIGGQLCTLADDSEPVSSVTPLPPVMDGEQQPGDEEDGQPPKPPVMSRMANSHKHMRLLLAKATKDELAGLQTGIIKAEEAAKKGHVNGEWDVVVKELNRLAQR